MLHPLLNSSNILPVKLLFFELPNEEQFYVFLNPCNYYFAVIISPVFVFFL